MSQVCGDYRISVIKHQRHSVKSRTFFSFSLDFSKNYGIIPACWLESQRGTHPSMQVVSHRRGKPSLINHLAVFYACKMNMNNVAHKNLEFIRDTHKFITLLGIYERIRTKFSTNYAKQTQSQVLRIWLSSLTTSKYGTETFGEMGKQSQYKANSNPIQSQTKPILAQKSGGQTHFKPNFGPIIKLAPLAGMSYILRESTLMVT